MNPPPIVSAEELEAARQKAADAFGAKYAPPVQFEAGTASSSSTY
jgi:hypothetical protein